MVACESLMSTNNDFIDNKLHASTDKTPNSTKKLIYMHTVLNNTFDMDAISFLLHLCCNYKALIILPVLLFLSFNHGA